MTTETERVTPLLAGMDMVYFSCDLPLSDAMRERLTQEKTIAQARPPNGWSIARSGWKRVSPHRVRKVATLSSSRPRTSASSCLASTS
jgi:hypothetical protein